MLCLACAGAWAGPLKWKYHAWGYSSIPQGYAKPDEMTRGRLMSGGMNPVPNDNYKMFGFVVKVSKHWGGGYGHTSNCHSFFSGTGDKCVGLFPRGSANNQRLDMGIVVYYF